MRQRALLNLDFAGRDFPLRRRRGNQHGPRRGAGHAQLRPGIGHRVRAACALNGSEGEIVIKLRVRRREFRAHLRPVGVHLLGDNCREAGGYALALVEMLDQHGHRAVRRDAHEGGGHRPVLRRCGEDLAGRRNRRADHQRASRAGSFQKIAPRGLDRGERGRIREGAGSVEQHERVSSA